MIAVRDQECKALGTVHGLVLEAIAATANLPPGLAQQVNQAAADVKAAKTLSLPDFAKVVSKFTLSIAKAVGQVQRASQGATGAMQIYGGTLGGGIFDAITTGHTRPALKAFLHKFDVDTKNCSHSDRRSYVLSFLPELLGIAVRNRKAVAAMSCSRKAESFGEPIPGENPLEDPVSEWKSWATLMVQQFNALLEPHWQGYRESHPTCGFKEFLQSCPQRQGLDGGRISLPAEDGMTTMELATMDCASGTGHWMSCTQDDTVGTCHLFEWSVADGDAHMTFANIACIHSPVKGGELVSQLGPIVVDVLDWEPSLGLNDLKQSLLKIQHPFSHASNYQRGQAAITEELLVALADERGFVLKWGQEFTRPNPTPDQHALAKLQLAKYLPVAAPQLNLTPVGGTDDDQATTVTTTTMTETTVTMTTTDTTTTTTTTENNNSNSSSGGSSSSDG